MTTSQVDSAMPSEPPTVRRRVRQACDACRRRRRKCDGLQPCAQCRFFQYDCSFSKHSNTSDGCSASGAVASRPSPMQVRDDEAQHCTSHNSGDTAYHLRKSGPMSPIREINTDAGCPDDELGIATIAETPTSFFHARKGRYCGIHSSIVFPRKVRFIVGGPADERLHSYAWNVNLRAEPPPPAWSSVRRFITYQEILTYSNVFLQVLNPVLGIFDPEIYRERSRAYWIARDSPLPDFEAVVASVVALGSLFAEEPSAAEAQLVEQVKSILEIGCCYAPGRQSVDQAAAWALRTLYLRLTTRPSIAWLASCTGMHVAEAIALHISQVRDETDTSNTRIRVLHLMVFLNASISAEYGRSRVRFNECQSDFPGLSQPSVLSNLAGALFDLEPALESIDRTAALQKIVAIPTGHEVLELFKVDIAIHWYRRQIHSQNCQITARETGLLVDLLEGGLLQVEKVVACRHPWWTAVSTPFHSSLLLIAMDSDKSLALVQKALNCLRSVSEVFSASLAAEAVETAERLASTLKQKKFAHLRALGGVGGGETVDGGDSLFMTDSTISSDQLLLDNPPIDWLDGGEDGCDSLLFWPVDAGGGEGGAGW
ncbi:hypothetical protein M409DRAFT_61698 [Zasmidium cellare ATCC 36951]|uniref:Zn(2)-C6 fungal-type domain-containing protein n=1 Tax=Zasmidium cellare ATCC 36951 TaxID=1080233 RepID=A0A6A6BUL7_ZASCE|nr:uncharacterized protein M409DRAFT_61698 [Zasmidium cellare ATCC 36951]KAF2158385.1 hypothetical protein M409DRAFT_61698 [Zasmidium cellare ATCC 36951]